MKAMHMIPPLGVTIVTFNATDEIMDCLESLLSTADADGVPLEVAIVDNASTDGTAELIEAWRDGLIEPSLSLDIPFEIDRVQKPVIKHRLEVLRAPFNGGFACGVNQGISHLMARPEIDRVWVLNPDGIVAPGALKAIMAEPADFGLLGGRTIYVENPDSVQTDGGRINSWTGVTSSHNLFVRTKDATFPRDKDLDFISGANITVSRTYWERIGQMEESYFLYYEEVDWAQRRGTLPLKASEEIRIYHRAGASIGSASMDRRASPFAMYFLHRGRHRFMRRFFPNRWPVVWAFSIAKALQLVLKRDIDAADALLRGAADLTPPDSVMQRLTVEAARKALSGKAFARYMDSHSKLTSI